MPASRLIASALASAYPTRVNTAAAASNRRCFWTSRRTSSGGAWRPRGIGCWVGSSAVTSPRSLDRLPAVRSAALLCALAIGAAGCGGSPRDSTKEFEGEEQQVAAAVEQIEKAARDDKPATVCDRLFTDARL